MFNFNFQFSNEILARMGGAHLQREMMESIKYRYAIMILNILMKIFMYKEDVDLANASLRMENRLCAGCYRLARERAGTARKQIFDVIKKEKISQFSKYYSFKNQRLMQIKMNCRVVILHCHGVSRKSLRFYVLIFEHYTIKTIKKLIMQIRKH